MASGGSSGGATGAGGPGGDGSGAPSATGPAVASSGGPRGLDALRATGVPARLEFPGMEESVLELWEDLDAFQKQLELTKDKPEFTFYDGPPFATGLPHYGHILAGEQAQPFCCAAWRKLRAVWCKHLEHHLSPGSRPFLCHGAGTVFVDLYVSAQHASWFGSLVHDGGKGSGLLL